MRIPLAALALVLAAGLGAAAGASAWSSDRAIFTADAAREKWGWLYRSGAAAWTPALADVLGLEERLPDYIRGEFARRKGHAIKKPLWERAKTYKRQYAGVRKQKRRFIHANFFCHDMGRNWLTEPVVVSDGGDCFFTVEYDVDSRSFAMLIVNGEA